MTDDRMALAQLLEKGSDSDLLREMISYVAQRLMHLDVEGLVGAGHGERGEGRVYARVLCIFLMLDLQVVVQCQGG